ncbi:MAG TPA: efflux RND transporter permease subunit [Methylomirabilota bacterium]|nr:efflux RND transporter permease subunit [Methylomirabilota bacterium]
MLRRIIEGSLAFRGVVVTLAGLLLGYGLFVTAHAKLDVFPEFAPPEVVIFTEAAGFSPEDVEALVTTPIENVVNGVSNLQAIRSQSIEGLSVITVLFRQGTDILRARQLVGERLLDVTGRMPQGVTPPTMAPLTSATSTTLVVGLASDQRSPMELRTFADWTLRPRLLGVPGVAKVVIFGGEVRQLQIQVRPDRLLAYRLAIDDVLQAGRQASGVRGAGFVDTGPQRIGLRTQGQSLTPSALGQVVVGHHNGLSIRLTDVAYVVEGPEPKISDVSIQGRPGVMAVVSSQYGANTLDVTRALDQALADLAPTMKSAGIVLYPALFRPANFITTAIDNVKASLLIGGLLVVIVLFVFLLDLRTAFISFAAIPLSLLAAIIVLDRLGLSLNTLTLGGLTIAVGIVVDDAIIDVENVWRRLRENGALATPRPSFQVVRDAVLEVRGPVVYATAIVVLIFFPVLTLSGVEGRLFGPLAIASILAIGASLGVAITLTPALCLMLLARMPAAEPRYIRWLKDHHRGVLETLSRQPGLVIGGAALLFAGSAATLPFFGGAFLPEFREGHFIVHMVAVPGTSLEESLRIGRLVTAELLQDPDVRSVAQRAGRAEQADDTNGPHYSEFEVELNPLTGQAGESAEARIRRILGAFPGVAFAVKPFLTERIEETVSGATAQVVVKMFGDDLDLIDQKAREVAHVLSGIQGATEVQVQSPPGVPQVMVRLRADRLTQFGFQPVAVLDGIQTAYQGRVVAQIYQGNRVFDIAVILDARARRDPERIGALMLRNVNTARLPLRELADIYTSTGRYAVLHDSARRVQVVTCNVVGRDVVSFVQEAKRKIGRTVVFPVGFSAAFAGAAEAQAQAREQLLLHSAMAGVGVVLLLALVFGNARNLLLVLANLPFALVGGVLAIFGSGGVLALGSLVGFVTLFGVTTRNSILLVSHYEQLVGVEGRPWGLETALRGAEERLVPILMTALVTGLGLVPLAIGSGEAGREIEGPMALVILGGLLTSTVLNLLVLPTLALRYGRFERQSGSLL